MLLLILVFLLVGFNHIESIEGCNEAVCASIVSKCTLLKSCDCDLTAPECPCCKKCYACLEHLYDECCSCVGLCQDTSSTSSTNSLNDDGGGELQSQMAKLGMPDRSLFNALTQHGDDIQQRWTSITFPVDIPIDPDMNGMSPNSFQSTIQETFVTKNCTVSYLSQCRSMNKCKKSCESMGAASFRWFHDSCCECVGSNCVDFGLVESRCSACPEPSDEQELTDEELEELLQFYNQHELAENDDVSSPQHTSTTPSSTPKKKKKI